MNEVFNGPKATLPSVSQNDENLHAATNGTTEIAGNWSITVFHCSFVDHFKWTAFYSAGDKKGTIFGKFLTYVHKNVLKQSCKI